MRRVFFLAAVTCLSVALAADTRYSTPADDTAYWVWRWSDLALVDPADSLLLYQGDFYSAGASAAIEKRGIDPFALPGRTETGLLVRLYDIGDAPAFADHVAYLVRQWQSREIDITEVQLDYDCPSDRLPEYRRFIDRVRTQLDRDGLHVPLSTTGLLTWLTDNPRALDRLAVSTSYIAFQLYDEHDPVANLDAYFVSLKHYRHPYRIGISTSEKFNRMEYPRSENYQGNLVFLNVLQ